MAAALGGVLLAALALSACNQKPIIGPALVLEPSATMSHQVGHFDAGDKSMVAMPGEKGFLAFGPYAALPAGLYRATFAVSVEGADDVAGRVDVNAFNASQAGNVVASSELKNGQGQNVSLDFTATAEPRYEFRVATAGTATIRLLGIVVKRHP